MNPHEARQSIAAELSAENQLVKELAGSLQSALAAQRTLLKRLIQDVAAMVGRSDVDPGTIEIVLRRLHAENERG